jgi:hypothetical protein
VHLVIARCGKSPLLMGETEALDDADQAALLDDVSSEAACDLAQTLPSGQIAVGRRTGARCTWWVGEDFTIDPPHALWSEPTVWTVDGESVAPTPPDPAILLDALGAVGDIARAAKTVAGAVRLLRASDEPVCIVSNAPPATLEAMALTLVAVLGRTLSVAIQHPEPDPGRYRLALGSTVYDGYQPVLATDPPDEGDDLVAWYTRDRLRADPTALFQSGDGIDDDQVRRILQDDVLPPEFNREGRLRSLTARIRAGADVDGPLLAELIALTELTGDARPWVALQRRPSVTRRQAVEAALERSFAIRPTVALLRAISAVYPRGAPLAPWCIALLDWTREAAIPGPFVAALESALDEWPQSATRANRVSVWTELVQILVERGLHADALAAITGPLAETLVREGSGPAIATMWGTLPPDHRNPRRLAGLVELLVRHPEGDRAAAEIYRHVHHNEAEVAVLVKTWLKSRGTRSIEGDDALLNALMHGDHQQVWLDVAMEVYAPAVVVPAIAHIATGPEDPVWLAAESALAAHTDAARRFTNLSLFVGGLVALEPLARALVEQALEDAGFPDPTFAETARLLIDVPGSAPIWPWLAVVAARPDRFEDDVVDGTVVSLCERPPANGVERQLCARAAERLGAAGEWAALDHARWVVRLVLAPDGDQTGFRDTLIDGLVAGLVSRFDAAVHIAGIARELLALPPEHPAVQRFFHTALPNAWRGRVPIAFLDAVEAAGVPDDTKAIWDDFGAQI